jgi:hypothetical protein
MNKDMPHLQEGTQRILHRKEKTTDPHSRNSFHARSFQKTPNGKKPYHRPLAIQKLIM